MDVKDELITEFNYEAELLQLVNGLSNIRNYSECLKVLTRLIELFPSCSVAYALLGETHCILGEEVIGVEYLRKAQNLDNGHLDVAIIVARTYLKLGQRPQAIQVINDILAFYPHEHRLQEAQLQILAGARPY